MNGGGNHEGERKKIEALYLLARETYNAEDKRFDDAERKIGRYLSLLFIILGLSTISADQLINLVRDGLNVSRGILALAAVGFYASAIISFFYLVRAIRVQAVPALGVDHRVVDYFAKYSYEKALRGLAPAFLNAAGKVRSAVQRKLLLAARGFVALLVLVGFAVLAAVAYIMISMVRDSDTAKDNRRSDQTQAAPSSTPTQTSSGDDAEADATALFETLKKSFEGGGPLPKKK